MAPCVITPPNGDDNLEQVLLSVVFWVMTPSSLVDGYHQVLWKQCDVRNVGTFYQAARCQFRFHSSRCYYCIA